MCSSSLAPPTERLWSLLERAGELEGFILIGGTALAMLLHHRISEDLDFIQGEPGRLPRGRISALRRRLEAAGWALRANPSPALVDQYKDSGADWADYQQDIIAGDPEGGTVKLRIAVGHPENLRCLDAPSFAGGPRVASAEELFRLECMALGDPTKQRRWLDLYVLLRSGRFDAGDFIETFDSALAPQMRDIALMRMTSGKLLEGNEGYSGLLKQRVSHEAIKVFFKELVDQVEQDLAARQFRTPSPWP